VSVRLEAAAQARREGFQAEEPALAPASAGLTFHGQRLLDPVHDAELPHSTRAACSLHRRGDPECPGAAHGLLASAQRLQEIGAHLRKSPGLLLEQGYQGLSQGTLHSLGRRGLQQPAGEAQANRCVLRPGSFEVPADSTQEHRVHKAVDLKLLRAALAPLLLLREEGLQELLDLGQALRLL